MVNTIMQSRIIIFQRTYTIALFLFLTIIGSYAAVFAQGEQKTTGGLQLILKPVKSDFVMGEVIDMRLDIQNIKSEPIVIIKPIINKILHGWLLTGYVSAPGGKKSIVEPVILYQTERFLEREDFIQLKPGEKISIEIHFDSHSQRGGGSGQWEVGPIGNGPVRDDMLKECFSNAGEYTIKFILSRPKTLPFKARMDNGRSSISLQETAGFSPRSFILENTIDKYYEFIDDEGHVRQLKVDTWTGIMSSNEVKILITKQHSN